MEIHRYEVIDASYFETAPVRFDDRLALDYPADVVWEIFHSNEAWHAFDPGIASAQWTSAPPVQAGSTRRVHFSSWLGGGYVDEVFFEWKPNERFAFYMRDGTSTQVQAYGELWSLADLGGGRTELRLQTAFSLNPGYKNPIARLISPILNIGYQGTLRSVKRYLDKQQT